MFHAKQTKDQIENAAPWSVSSSVLWLKVVYFNVCIGDETAPLRPPKCETTSRRLFPLIYVKGNCHSLA